MTEAVNQEESETAHQDDRLKVHQGFAKLIRRPELASFFGVIVVFALFMFVAPAFRSLDAFAEVLYVSSTLGIVALAVGLLMIGDEFDLSSGVAVTSAALAAAMLNYYLGLNSWEELPCSWITHSACRAFASCNRFPAWVPATFSSWPKNPESWYFW